MLYAIIFVSILFRHASPHQDIQNLWCKPAAVGDGQGACGAVCARSGSDHGFTSGLPFSVRMYGVATICWRADGTRHTSSPLG